jgi:hypothetical protein
MTTCALDEFCATPDNGTTWRCVPDHVERQPCFEYGPLDDDACAVGYACLGDSCIERSSADPCESDADCAENSYCVIIPDQKYNACQRRTGQGQLCEGPSAVGCDWGLACNLHTKRCEAESCDPRTEQCAPDAPQNVSGDETCAEFSCHWGEVCGTVLSGGECRSITTR